ncbi:Potassium channel SKOR [Camellia lanceoleosa]|uniref:Potassium channel SKOR n=1 Tax=Camellia lanceoleosa TaxID=1840588 RepID=A0ACC0FJV3_9ERIC|nr:Potassium channel SKOR [Camellia lanceoleosa]
MKFLAVWIPSPTLVSFASLSLSSTVTPCGGAAIWRRGGTALFQPQQWCLSPLNGRKGFFLRVFDSMHSVYVSISGKGLNISLDSVVLSSSLCSSLEEVDIGADGSEETVSNLEPNNLFDEISILCNIPQPYTVRV